MKKVIALLLALICLTFTFAGCDTTEKPNNTGNVPSPAKDFEFEAGENGLTVTKYLGSEKKVVIPSVVDNKKVVGLKPEVFGGNIVIEEMVLSDYMTELFLDHFSGCDNLKILTCSGFTSCDMYISFDAKFVPKNLTTIVFPSMKAIDVKMLDDIHAAAPYITTFICNSSVEIKNISFRNGHKCTGNYNIVISDTLLKQVKSKTALHVNQKSITGYRHETIQTQKLDCGWCLESSFNSIFADNKFEITDKSKIDAEVITFAETLVTKIINKDHKIIDSKYSILANQSYFEFIYEVSDGIQSYIDCSFVDINSIYRANIYECTESKTDPNLAVTTAFGRVDSITVNGTTYSYDHE